MKIKTSELTGVQLDYSVAVCLGTDNIHFQVQWEQGHRNYSSVWDEGGPIIDRELIGTDPIFACSSMNHPEGYWYWQASRPSEDGGIEESYYGPTPLIAAMRCYVASKLGDELEVPDELLEK